MIDPDNLVYFPRDLRRGPRLSAKKRDALAKLHNEISYRFYEVLEGLLEDLIAADRAVGRKQPLKDTIETLQVDFAEWVEQVWASEPAVRSEGAPL